MIKVDAHHHLWKYSPVEHAWINDDMKVLQQDFLAEDFHVELQKAGYTGCVAVQASQSEAETRFLLSEASVNPFVLGVVGWVNLSAPNVAERLEYFSQFTDFKGVRHVLQDEEDDQYMLRPEFLRGIAALAPLNLTYDILIFPKHLPYAYELVAQFPEQAFVIDHIAKPDIKHGEIDAWAEQIHKIASLPNVSCKLSGMVTEADWNNWTKEDIQRYVQVVFEAFGEDRVMIGSDWPVCKLAGEYGEVMDIVASYFTNPIVKEKVLGLNAINFYGLRLPVNIEK